ncbi:MAG: GntR family transcriptional repressor for pyruvate dehydrogenase complex [Alphaproteobacteria bacterium]|jgi:GntR family transcriptional repressor for pyruvate dehydrogenase complex
MNLELQTIKSDSLYIKVAEQLKKLINNESIKPGERFPLERELAEQLGVSRPTIRGAMIALELSGVIEIRTGSGIYVTHQQNRIGKPVTDKGVGPFEILEIRYIIEAEACALAAARITDEQLAKLRNAINEMEEEKQSNASERADQKFHSIIAQACENSAISSVVDWLWKLRNESDLNSMFLERIREEGIHPSIQEHKNILAALEQRNPERVRTAMKMHLENATANANAATHFNK